MKKLIILLLIAALAFSSGCVRSYKYLAPPITVVEEKAGSSSFSDGAENTLGATAGEARTGYCVRQGGGVYFIRFRDSGKKQLCRYDIASGEIYQIKDDFKAYFINVLGDSLYYAASDFSLNKMSITTGETQRISAGSDIIQFIASNDDVFFGWKVPDPNADINSRNKNDVENADKYYGYIARQPFGQPMTRIVDGLAQDERFFIDGDRLYYIGKFDKNVMSVDLDGNDELSANFAPRYTSAWFPHDGYIYAVVDDGGIRIARHKADGTGETQLLTDTVESLKFFGIEDGALYYVNGSDVKLSVHRLNLETLESETLLNQHELDKEYMYFNLAGGALFMYPAYYASSALLDLDTLDFIVFK